MKMSKVYVSTDLTERFRFLGKRYFYFIIYLTIEFKFVYRVNDGNYFYDGYHNSIQIGFIGIDWN